MTALPKTKQPTRAELIERDKVCIINLPGCSGRAETLDHRANRGSGGSKVLNSAYCLIGACKWCNGAKENATGDVLAELKRRGVRVEKAATNMATAVRCHSTPVEYPDGVLRRLTTDGRAVVVVHWITDEDAVRRMNGTVN